MPVPGTSNANPDSEIDRFLLASLQDSKKIYHESRKHAPQKEVTEQLLIAMDVDCDPAVHIYSLEHTLRIRSVYLHAHFAFNF